MADAVAKRLLDAIKTELSAITGMQHVWLGAFPIDLGGRANDTAFPVAAVKILSADPEEVSLAGGSPLIYRTNNVALVVLDNGRTESDEDWSSDRAFELEKLVMAAILADRTHGGLSRNTTWTGTTYTPEGDWAQVDTSVAMTFDIITRNKEADTSAGDP